MAFYLRKTVYNISLISKEKLLKDYKNKMKFLILTHESYFLNNYRKLNDRI